MQFWIGDRPALNSLPFSAESGISRQQPLVRLAVDHILRASQDVDTSPGLTIGRCFTVTVGRTACAWAAVVIAIAAKTAAATAKVTAVLMIITFVPLAG